MSRGVFREEVGTQSEPKGRIVQEENDEPDLNVEGLRKLFDWVEKDAGKTVLVSGIQTVGSKFWE